MPLIGDAFRPALLRYFSAEEMERCQLHFQGLIVKIISLPWLRQGAAAITFGRRIFLRPDYWEQLDFPSRTGLLAHEMTHVRQYGRYGFLLFLACYMLLYPLYFWRVSQHPLERPAYQMGQEVEQALRSK